MKAAVICELQNWSYSDGFFRLDQKIQLYAVFNNEEFHLIPPTGRKIVFYSLDNGINKKKSIAHNPTQVVESKTDNWFFQQGI